MVTIIETGIVCLTVIVLYGMSIIKSRAEKEKAEALARMHMEERRNKVSQPPPRKG